MPKLDMERFLKHFGPKSYFESEEHCGFFTGTKSHCKSYWIE